MVDFTSPHDTTSSVSGNRRADAMLTWAKRVHAAREELDEATGGVG